MMRATECFDEHTVIQEKIQRARTLCRKLGEIFREQPGAANPLKGLRNSTKVTWRTMHELGVVEACKNCPVRADY
jgi:hypothetical protein